MKVVLRALVALICLCLSHLSVAASGPASPQPGLWWNPQENGRGFTIDPQGELMVVTTFAYDNYGQMQWYYSDGPLSNGGYRWSGRLYKFNFGQPLNGGYFGTPTLQGDDGVLTLEFTSRATGFATLPGGRRIPIERMNFGVGAPPNALLGQWAMVYKIGTSPFADMYVLSKVISATSTGNGVVTNTQLNAGFEYQVSGTFAGKVIGFHYSSTGTVLDQYLFSLMLEEGRGDWVSPTTFNTYGMNVYKTHTPGGISKAIRADDPKIAVDLAAKGVSTSSPGVTFEKLAEQDPERAAIAERMWNALQAR